MKKLAALLLALVLTLVCVACGSPAQTVPDTIKGVTFDVPEGFTADKEGLWLADTYPVDGSNIMVQEASVDPGFSAYSEKTVAAAIEKQYKEQYDYDVTVSFDFFESVELNGVPGYRMALRYEMSGYNVYQLEYVFSAKENSYIVVFTDMNDGEKADAFAKAGETLKLTVE